MSDGDTHSLSDCERAIDAFARKVTRVPAAMSESDVAVLRRHGLSDRAIYDAAAIASFFNFVNRVALSLGVPLEPDWENMLDRGTLP